MKVAILNRQRAAFPGGDLVQIDATIEALSRRNIEAEYAPEGWTVDWLRGFDLVHMFHISFGWSVYNYERTIESNVPYVVTPIFYPAVNLGASVRQMRNILRDAERILPFSQAEWDEMTDVLHITRAEASSLFPQATPIPNGTDPVFHGSDDLAGRSGVIAVVARTGDKNTHLVRNVCRDLDVQFTEVCGVESREELAGIYKRAAVFVNASTSERMSLTTGEALCAGCRVIDTVHNRGRVWYGRGLVTIDPTNSQRLRQAIQSAFTYVDWDYSPNRAARRLTWDLVAEGLDVGVYRPVLAGFI